VSYLSLRVDISRADGLVRYDFEYEDADEEEGGDIGIENKYYNAKQIKSDSPEEALEEFLGIPDLEQDKGEWGFKGLKQAIKLELRLGRYEDVSETASQSELAGDLTP
jgi:COP9 signalosome complex subunit 2